MASGHEDHAHEHEFMEIIDSETITAFEGVPHGIITLQLHQRGLSIDLTYEEAMALEIVIKKVVEYINTKYQN